MREMRIFDVANRRNLPLLPPKTPKNQQINVHKSSIRQLAISRKPLLFKA